MQRSHGCIFICQYTKISFNTISKQFNKIFMFQSWYCRNLKVKRILKDHIFGQDIQIKKIKNDIGKKKWWHIIPISNKPGSKTQSYCQAQRKHRAFLQLHFSHYSSLHSKLYHKILLQSMLSTQNYLSFLSVHPGRVQALQLLVLPFVPQV